MTAAVLNDAQIEHFIDKGWVKLERAYAEADALAAQTYVWSQVERRGVLRSDRSTWTKPMVRMNENYDTPEFRACQTDRLLGAIEDLIGPGQWLFRERPIRWGWWPVNFSQGAERAWDVPTEAWHIDGIHHPQFLDSPEQGLLLLCIFSEIGPRGGGTLVVEGSHNIVARILKERPEGLAVKEVNEAAKRHPYLAELTGSRPIPDGLSRIERFMERETVDDDGFRLRVVETTGRPGDVIIGHPFLFHAASPNHTGAPRFMCNNQAPLRDRIRLDRPPGESHTPLERSIRKAVY
ncbi:phytanoyl-CoA dioxygenase family protein [Paenibacillus antri]|uniref:Phytanoyl-CoA dioxygenase family protein n=1 Tax=Paenibacillus antri TaxID=2582848 RepID=A0A5R9G873_9BACL|nr:phytanoyl-CoA dioxygenase family protein [Paenibacillus antri]TLS52617.1 phytanoyl-CoA dioxygenase family protein [Paenibacillus antri]